MSTRILLGLTVVTLVGCSESKRWIETRATQLHVGTLEVDIPAGWRDINELSDKSFAAKVPPGARLLIHENLAEPGEMLVFPILMAVSGDDCTNFAKFLEGQGGGRISISDAQGARFAGNPGCMMHITVETLSGYLRVVTPKGGATVGVRCVGNVIGLREACDKIVYGLHPTKP
jgi:hypothetical protein